MNKDDLEYDFKDDPTGREVREPVPLPEYFTPDREDIRIGYECEILREGDNSWWNIMTIVSLDNYSPDFILSKLEDKQVRVPYLTKKQIEAEGWKFKQTTYYWNAPEIPIGDCFEKGNWWLVLEKISFIKIIPIDASLEKTEHMARYTGNCKSINEFRYLMKMLEL